jgi:NAD(P)H-dependent flavin oxidoreductase YrpB (nitropropane dioxygenase family)
MLALAVRNGLAFSQLTGVSVLGLLRSGLAMQKNTDLTLGQTMMAANAPMMIQEAMVNGHPSEGILPSGQVAGVITELPTVAELIERIMTEAEQTLRRVQALQQ